MQNLNVFAFALENIFVEHDDVKTSTRWFFEQKKR